MRFAIQNHEVMMERLYVSPIMAGYIECCNYAEGAAKNFARFKEYICKTYGDDHFQKWHHFDEPPTKLVGYNDEVNKWCVWRGYYIAVELKSNKCVRDGKEWDQSAFRCTLWMEEFDTNKLTERLQKVDWEKEAINTWD
jgi:hypothetical protein